MFSTLEPQMDWAQKVSPILSTVLWGDWLERMVWNDDFLQRWPPLAPQASTSQVWQIHVWLPYTRLKLLHRFWSQVVFDKSLHASLVSFLQEAPRFYSEEEISDPRAKQLLENVQKLVFLAFLRMSTHKESKVLGCFTCMFTLSIIFPSIEGILHNFKCLWGDYLWELCLWYSKTNGYSHTLWTIQQPSSWQDVC